MGHDVFRLVAYARLDDAVATDAFPGELNLNGARSPYACTTTSPVFRLGENSRMNFQKIIVPVLGVVGVVLAYRFYGLAGVAAAATAIVMWVLLHFTRMVTILKRAANRPIGYVDSAVMLNAKLKPGMTLLHVVAMTRALGALQSAKDEQPEIFRWTDGGASQVSATFVGGKLMHHELFRPVTTALESAPEPVNIPANEPAS